MSREDGRNDSADRPMPPQAAGMSCYSVAQEITSICADFLVELRGFEPMAIARVGIRQVGNFMPAPIYRRSSLQPGEGGSREADLATNHGYRRRPIIRQAQRPRRPRGQRKAPRSMGEPTRGSALVSDGTCTGPGRSPSSAAPSQSTDLSPL
jgi:hypothetical protein